LQDDLRVGIKQGHTSEEQGVATADVSTTQTTTSSLPSEVNTARISPIMVALTVRCGNSELIHIEKVVMK